MRTMYITIGFLYYLLLITLLASSCRKAVELPLVETLEVSELEQLHAVSGGSLSDNGGAEVTDCGICWAASENPTLSDFRISCGIGKAYFVARMTSLTPATRYYVRAYAINEAGTAYGDQLDFETKGISLPEVLTTGITVTGMSTANAGGYIYNSGGTLITEKGICWSTTPSPTISNNRIPGTDAQHTKGLFSCTLSGLSQGTRYFVRAYAVNEAGLSYGSEFSFTTLSVNPPYFNPDLTYGSVTDIDANSYRTVEIGTQTWMAENLRTTRYNDGSEIQVISSDNTWTSISSGAMCWYLNNQAFYGNIYGGYYNFYAVNTRKLCPSGWHVPDKSEWLQLISLMGGEVVAGGKLKEAGINNWVLPNADATNESGFTGLPAGYRWNKYFGQGSSAYFWTSTTTVSGWTTYSHAYSMESMNLIAGNVLFSNPRYGLSVRCVKD